MAGFGLRTLKWGYSRLRSRDIFKQTVSLTFRGKSSYSTVIGGIVTTVIVILIAIFGVTLTKKMFDRSDVEWLNTQRYRDRIYDPNNYTIKESEQYYYIEFYNWSNASSKFCIR